MSDNTSYSSGVCRTSGHTIGQLKEIADTENVFEMVSQNHTVIRILEREPMTASAMVEEAANNYVKTKETLSALGMEQDFIESLSVEDLNVYASSPSIKAAVSYFVVDGVSGEMTCISEEEALRGAAAVTSDPAIGEMAQDYIQDTYMRVWHAVTNLGASNYKFVTDARWLTMPFFRGTDSIGSCSMNTTVTPGTASGYMEFKQQSISGLQTTTLDRYEAIETSDIKYASNGSFYGAGAVFNLPNDVVISEAQSTTFYDFKVHFEYQGHLMYPELETWFNSTGTYTHATVGISGIPTLTVTIDSSGSKPSGSIGITVAGIKEPRSVLLELHYVP